MIQQAGADGAVHCLLAGVYRLGLAAVQLGAHIVEVRHHLQPVFLEREVAVGIEKVGLILVDEVGHAVKIMTLP